MHLPGFRESASEIYRIVFVAVVIVFCLMSIFSSIARAQTQYLPDADQADEFPFVTGPRGDMRSLEWPTERFNYMFELAQICHFLSIWQETTPGPDFGGMIEAEAGHLGDVIQTDNTLEAIWVWSHYTLITGSTTYLQNIANAWIYCLNFPPWLEEGSTDYYRVHNCAWALTAESAYRAATGDNTYVDYGATSADYIVDSPLYLSPYQKLNAFVQAWAAGNLYLYGEEMLNTDWCTSAVAYGEVLADWIENDPPQNLALETWAMSSGTLVWGLCKSLFSDDPDRGIEWVANYGALVDTFQVWYNVPGDSYDWDNSWNVAYINAHFAMGELADSALHTEFGVKLTHQLLSYDTDDDGGIPATTMDPVTEDMSWVTSYLAKFGVAHLLGTPEIHDAGILSFQSPVNGDVIYLPDAIPMPITVTASNFGLADLSPVTVRLISPVFSEVTLDLDYLAREDIVLIPDWLATTGGEIEFVAVTSFAGDTNTSNDTLRITIQVDDPASIEPGPLVAEKLFLHPAWPNPFVDTATLMLDRQVGHAAEISIISPAGRRVRGWDFAPGEQERVSASWNGCDQDGCPVSAGVYFVRARSGAHSTSRRVIRMGK